MKDAVNIPTYQHTCIPHTHIPDENQLAFGSISGGITRELVVFRDSAPILASSPVTISWDYFRLGPYYSHAFSFGPRRVTPWFAQPAPLVLNGSK